MLRLLLCLLPLVSCSRSVSQDTRFTERLNRADDVAVTTRPHIYYCRSPNMEDFSCWWHPLDNLTDGEEVAYRLIYSLDGGPIKECPDYLTSGPNSCHFDSTHTIIWKPYCMTVMAITAQRNYTSQEHCLDVAEIVQTEAPVNLTYKLKDAGGDEMGHDALLSWTYPMPSHLMYGWITLEFELQYRRVTEPDNWKVKYPLRDPHVDLLGLPVGDYVVRVRCRSQNSGVWSKWGSTLLMSIPGQARPPAGKLLVRILVSGVGVVALLVIAFGIIPQSKRIKDYFLPPIPKPRIVGIDPLLLKKGNLDEINRHFSNFHSYRPPSYTEEVWDQVSADDVCLTTPRDCYIPAAPTEREKDALMVPGNLAPVAAHHPFTTPNPSAYVQSLSPYCSPPPEAFASPLDVPSAWPHPEIVSLPGTEYSVMGHPGLPNPFTAPETTAVPTSRTPQDFYTCVQLMNDSGQVHLVPCLPPAYCQEFPSSPKVDLEAEEKKKKLADYHARMNVMSRQNDGCEMAADRSEAADPLLPVAVDNRG